jgi:hypothetical protein
MRSTRVAVLASALFLFACGGGGGGGGNSPTPATNLAGTWSGQLEDGNSVMHTVQVTIDATGKITQIKQDGTIVQDGSGTGRPLTGNVFVAGTNLYSFTFTDGTHGGFYADASATHMAFLDDNTNIGVLQNGATLPLPAFAATDIGGSWTGYDIDLDANLNVIRTYNTSANVTSTAPRAFTGTDAVNGGFGGQFADTPDLVNGRWTGTFTQTPATGLVHAFMSADKTFAGTASCPSTATDFIADCTFSVWHH